MDFFATQGSETTLPIISSDFSRIQVDKTFIPVIKPILGLLTLNCSAPNTTTLEVSSNAFCQVAISTYPAAYKTFQESKPVENLGFQSPRIYPPIF